MILLWAFICIVGSTIRYAPTHTHNELVVVSSGFYSGQKAIVLDYSKNRYTIKLEDGETVYVERNEL